MHDFERLLQFRWLSNVIFVLFYFEEEEICGYISGSFYNFLRKDGFFIFIIVQILDKFLFFMV